MHGQDARFEGIHKYGELVREIDPWAENYYVPVSPEWKFSRFNKPKK
jgi:hypothetical protein